MIGRGKPKMVVSDNGELTSTAILTWADHTAASHGTTRAGQPMQNAFVKSFNGRLRTTGLNETLFTSLAQARVARMLAGRLQRHDHTPSSDGRRRPVRHDLPPAPGSGAALCRRLRAWSRHSRRQQANRVKANWNWAKLGARSLTDASLIGSQSSQARSGKSDAGRTPDLPFGFAGRRCPNFSHWCE
jgi:hypothetical protein